MLKPLKRLVPLSFSAIAVVASFVPVSAEETLIDGQCQPNPPINLAANCRSASFIDPAKVEVYNNRRRFVRRVDYYGRGSDPNRVVRSLFSENVDCSDRKIATVQIVSYRVSGSSQSQTKPEEFVLPRQQTRAQKNTVRFVCSLN